MNSVGILVSLGQTGVLRAEVSRDGGGYIRSEWHKGGKWTKKLMTAFIITLSVSLWRGIPPATEKNQLQIIIALLLHSASAASGQRASSELLLTLVPLNSILEFFFFFLRKTFWYVQIRNSDYSEPWLF